MSINGVVPSAADISGTSVTVIGGVTVSGNQVFISGQPVYLVSGQNNVQISGQTVSIAGGVTVSGNAVRISGQTVISEISGQTIVVPSTSVSGNAIRISGQTVISEISGQTIVVPSTSVSGNAIRTSGQIAYLTSGQNQVQLYAYDPSGDALRPLIVNQSGGNVLRVDAGSINVASNVSGNVVYLTSGQNAVQNSGQIIYPVSGKGFMYAFDPSGTTWNEVYVDVSGGHAIKIAGNLSANVSGNAIRISGETVYPVSGKAFAYAFDPSGNTWNELWVSQSGGHDLRIFGSLSANVSGNAVRISGETVRVISGDVLRVAQNADTTYDAHSLIVTIGQDGNLAEVNANLGDALASFVGLMTYTTLYGYEEVNDISRRIRVTASGRGVSGIHHKLVVTFSGDSIIGSVSGNMVSISGQPVSVSGNMISTSGQPSPISGQKVRLQAYDPSGDTYNDLIVNQSGGNKLVVEASVTTNISGQTVYLVSGQNNVQISGQLVAVSGTVATSVSGNALRISGQTTYPVSGNAYLHIFDPSGATWNEVWVGRSGDHIPSVFLTDGGEQAQILTQFSDGMSTGTDPLVVAANIAAYDQVDNDLKRVRVTASGQGVSGIVHRLVVAFSGDVTKPQTPTQIRTRDTLLITGASGGIALLSGDVLRVTVKNIGISGTVMYVGGSGDYPWVASGQTIFPFFSGRGFHLRDGEGVTIHTSNMAFVRVVSHTSGQYISYLGEQY